MKVLQILVLTLGLAVFVNAQKAVLSGTVYDATGAVVIGVKVTATNEKEEKLENVTNDEEIYTLNLPFKTYNSKADFRIAKYELTVDKANGFDKFTLKDFKFVPSYSGKMIFDLALDTYNSNCGAGGCIQAEPITDVSNQKLSDKILRRPLENLPKNKIKGKINY